MNKRTRRFIMAGMLATLLLAGFGSYYASSAPDGLARVATDNGLDKGLGKNPGKSADQSADKVGQNPASGDSPLAGYSVRGVGSQRLSGGLAGIAGVGLTFVLVGGIAVVVRRRGADPEPEERHAGQSTGGTGAKS